METPAPDCLPRLDILLEHQQARLTDVRDRIEGSALHVMLFLKNLLRALWMFNGVRSRQCQRAFLVYHYHDRSLWAKHGRIAHLQPAFTVITMDMRGWATAMLP